MNILLSSTIELPELIYRVKKRRLILKCIADAEMKEKKVSFLFRLRALFPLYKLIGWSTHFLCGFPSSLTCKVILHSPKGQLISKCLFAVITFFQKTNENKSTSSKVEFVCSFFGRNVGLKK